MMTGSGDTLDAGERQWPESPIDTDAFAENSEAPTVEVRVFRHGALTHDELVESEEQAALVVEEWTELDGVTCEVDDLSVRHRAGQILEPELAELVDEEADRRISPDTPVSRYEGH
jgi:hypothetical protein